MVTGARTRKPATFLPEAVTTVALASFKQMAQISAKSLPRLGVGSLKFGLRPGRAKPKAIWL
jgi:hypothetical protein